MSKGLLFYSQSNVYSPHTCRIGSLSQGLVYPKYSKSKLQVTHPGHDIGPYVHNTSILYGPQIFVFQKHLPAQCAGPASG